MIGLPSLRTLDGAQGCRIWLAAEPTDMGCGFDRSAERVRTVMGEDPLGNGLFVFRSRSGDRLKILMWDRDGFVLCTTIWLHTTPLLIGSSGFDLLHILKVAARSEIRSHRLLCLAGKFVSGNS